MPHVCWPTARCLYFSPSMICYWKMLQFLRGTDWPYVLNLMFHSLLNQVPKQKRWVHKLHQMDKVLLREIMKLCIIQIGSFGNTGLSGCTPSCRTIVQQLGFVGVGLSLWNRLPCNLHHQLCLVLCLCFTSGWWPFCLIKGWCRLSSDDFSWGGGI